MTWRSACTCATQGAVATREALTAFARAAEERDIPSLWVSDHVIFPRVATGQYPGGRFPHPADTPYLEPVAVLAAVAMVTTRARLGDSVFILGHRHPVVMAKLLATIDVLSGGRLICGVGVGWWKEELEILGVPFERRGKHADEVVRAMKALWTEDNPRFEGEFSASATWASPPSRSRSRTRRSGSAATARRSVPPRGDAGRRLARDVPGPGRPDEEPGRAADGRGPGAAAVEQHRAVDPDGAPKEDPGGGPGQAIETLRAYKRLGMTHVMLDVRRDSLAEMLEGLDLLVREIRPAVAAG